MATMELASIPRELPQFGRHLTSLLRPASEVFGQQGSRRGKGSCGCGGAKGSCGCGGGEGSCGCGDGNASCGCSSNIKPACQTSSRPNASTHRPENGETVIVDGGGGGGGGGGNNVQYSCCCLKGVEITRSPSAPLVIDGINYVHCPVRVQGLFERKPSTRNMPTCEFHMAEFDAGWIRAQTGNPAHIPAGYSTWSETEWTSLTRHDYFYIAQAFWWAFGRITDGIKAIAGIEFVQTFFIRSTCERYPGPMQDDCLDCCILVWHKVAANGCKSKVKSVCGKLKPDGCQPPTSKNGAKLTPRDIFRDFPGSTYTIAETLGAGAQEQDLPDGQVVTVR